MLPTPSGKEAAPGQQRVVSPPVPVGQDHRAWGVKPSKSDTLTACDPSAPKALMLRGEVPECIERERAELLSKRESLLTCVQDVPRDEPFAECTAQVP